MLPRYENDHLCSDMFSHNARIYPHQTALVSGDASVTWRELDLLTNKVANALAGRGLSKGDKVCMFMSNSLDAFALFWGVVKAGYVIVPLNVMLDGPSLVRLINASEGTILFADASTAADIGAIRHDLRAIPAGNFYAFGSKATGWESARELIDGASTGVPATRPDPNDTMTIIYTSGTTGLPKGIEHSHFGRLNYPYGFGAGLRVDRYSVAICATPIYASGTWITMLPVLYNGGKIVLLPKFSAKGFLEAVEREGGTHSFMVPTQYIQILQESAIDCECSTLKVLVSAGQTIPEVTRRQLQIRFPKAGLYEVYGMTEGFFTIALPEDFALGKHGTVGKPGFLEDIKILGDDDREVSEGEVGEIVAYGPGMMKGYHNRPDLTEATVWVSSSGKTYLRSGDLGRVDSDGFLYVAGRKKDMIKSGGINIYASDLEDVVMAHPDVVEVAVVGVPDPKWSETPIAVVILRTGATMDDEALRAWANERLAKYQRLSRVIFRTELPRATYGKVQKDVLRSEFDHSKDSVSRGSFSNVS